MSNIDRSARYLIDARFCTVLFFSFSFIYSSRATGSVRFGLYRIYSFTWSLLAYYFPFLCVYICFKSPIENVPQLHCNIDTGIFSSTFESLQKNQYSIAIQQIVSTIFSIYAMFNLTCKGQCAKWFLFLFFFFKSVFCTIMMDFSIYAISNPWSKENQRIIVRCQAIQQNFVHAIFYALHIPWMHSYRMDSILGSVH